MVHGVEVRREGELKEEKDKNPQKKIKNGGGFVFAQPDLSFS